MNGIKKCEIQNDGDENGNPTGGSVVGLGINIKWQDGPLGRGEDRIPPNGAFVETVISAVKQRLEVFQESAFMCEENATAIDCLETALMHLESRTQRREDQGTEGTHAEEGEEHPSPVPADNPQANEYTEDVPPGFK